MMMPKFKKREKIIAVVLGGILFLFIAEKLFFSNIFSRIRKLKQQIKLEETNLNIGIQMQKKKDRIRNEYRAYESYLKVSEEPEQEIIANFLKEIEKIAQEAGVSIANLSPQSQAEQFKEGKRYKADLRAEGPVEKILTFLYKVQNSSLLIKLDKLSITPKDPQAETLKLDTIVSLTVI